MQRDAGVLREGLEPLAEELGVHVADLLGRERDVPDQERPPGDVDGGARQRLVHREVAVGVPRNPAPLAEGLRQRLPEHDAAVFRRVVEVDMEVTLRLQRDVDQGMAGELLDHVVEEADTGRDVELPRAVEVDRRLDPGLLRLPVDLCRACQVVSLQ